MHISGTVESIGFYSPAFFPAITQFAVDFLFFMMYNDSVIFAGVMELADVTDSKSVGSDTVWVRVPPPAPKIGKLKGLPIFYPLRKQWYIIAEGVYHHPTGCISSAAGCRRFRNDDIQNFVLMRYNTSC